MTPEEEVVLLREENKQLRALIEQALARIAMLEAELEQARNSLRSSAPLLVKASTHKKDDKGKQQRRKRAKDQNGTRHRETPTQTVEYRVVQCPDCAYPLRHPTLAKRRQVVELPPPQPIEVTEHQLYRSWCARCSKWHYASVDLSGQVVGRERKRIGVRVASLVAYLSTYMRMPVRLDCIGLPQ